MTHYENKRRRNHQSSHGMETGREKASRQTEEEVVDVVMAAKTLLGL